MTTALRLLPTATIGGQLELTFELELELVDELTLPTDREELLAAGYAAHLAAGGTDTAHAWRWHHEADYPAELVVVVPCSAAKAVGIYGADGALMTAAERYTGTFHTFARRHAERLEADVVVVLSAAGGLVPLWAACPEYDKQITDPDSVAFGNGPAKVAHQAAALGLLNPSTTVVSFCPTAYTAVLAAGVPNVVTPLAGARGIGNQRGRIARLTRADLGL